MFNSALVFVNNNFDISDTCNDKNNKITLTERNAHLATSTFIPLK